MAFLQSTPYKLANGNLSVDDLATGIKTQDATETFRRKRALADAFSASITTKPIIADSDIYDANGNRTQTKGDILARPGDIDKQKFFKHSADAGVGFEETGAVYNYYDMQKKSALSALKTGNEINALGGGTGVEGRAGAPVMRDQPAPQAQAQTATGQGAQDQTAPVAPEPSIEASKAKAEMIARMLASKKKAEIKKAQKELGVKVDGRVGNESKGALAQLQAKLSEGDWKPGEVDVFDATPDRTNTSNINGNIVTTPEHKLGVDSAFDPQASKFINAETMVGRPDTRTSLQVIEDRGGANNFGQSDSTGNSFDAPKLSEFGKYAGNVSSVLAKNGLSNDDAGIKKYLDFAVNAIPVFKYDTGKSASENKIIENKLNADRQSAYNKAKEGLASGVDVVKGQALASAANTRAETEFTQARTISKGLGDYGIKDLDPTNAAKAGEALKQFELGRSIDRATSELLKSSNKMTPDEISNAVKQPLMMMAQIEGAGNEKQEEGLMAGLRQDKGIAAILDANKGKSTREQISALAISKLTSQQQKVFLKHLNDYAKDIVKNGKARNELETYSRVTGGKFDPNAGEGSGASKALGKGLKPKSDSSAIKGPHRKATAGDF